MLMKLTVDKKHLVTHSPFDRAIFVWRVVPPQAASSSPEQPAKPVSKQRRKQ